MVLVYRILEKIFTGDDVRYTPKPWHIIYSIALIGAGVTVMYEGWFWTGLIFSLFGILMGFAIIIGIGWDKVIEYWSTLDSFANTMMKANNPDLWEALGFKVPQQTVTIIENNSDKDNPFLSTKIHRLPVSPATMQLIADKVLMTGNTDFIEADFKHIPNVRKVKQYMKDKGLLTQKNKRNPRLGYAFNRKGLNALYEFASESIRMELKRRQDG